MGRGRRVVFIGGVLSGGERWGPGVGEGPVESLGTGSGGADVVAARAALALNDRSAPASAGLAQLDREAGDQASAIQYAERAMRSQLRNWVYHRDLALLYRDAGRREEALVEARAARRYAPAWKQDELTELVDSLR